MSSLLPAGHAWLNTKWMACVPNVSEAVTVQAGDKFGLTIVVLGEKKRTDWSSGISIWFSISWTMLLAPNDILDKGQ